MTDAQPVRISGGGLAGLSLGIALVRAGVPVTIFEADDYPRHRVCGEFISGLSDATVAKLGIGSVFADAGSLRGVTWFRQGQAIRRQTLPEPARAISRHAMDTRLADLFIAGGGKLKTRTRMATPTDRIGWVDTTGRRLRQASPWLGLKFHARASDLTMANDLELHLGDGAYVGLSPVEDGWVNVCGLFRRRPGLQLDREQALSTYLQACGLTHLAERLDGATIRPDSRKAMAGVAIDHRIPTNPDRVQVGDACAMIPPFTGNGMAMAITGAALALDPLLAWSRGEQSWPQAEREIRRALRHEFRLRLGSAALLHPFLLKPPLQRSLGVAARVGILPLTALYRLTH